MDEASLQVDRECPEPADAFWCELDAADSVLADSTRADPTRSDRRIDSAITRVEEYASRAARDMAAQVAAIDDFLKEVDAAPHVFAGPNCRPGAEAAEFARRSAVSELAVTMAVSESTIHTYAETAQTLRGSLPGVWCAFQNGEISYQQARVIVEVARSFPINDNSQDSDFLDEFDVLMLDAAPKLTPSNLRRKARAARERLHPESAVARHRAALPDRRVWMDPGIDGMAWLGAFVSADAA